MAFAPTIHSIGDAQFLSQVLNAVAMIIGTNDFVQLVSIGLLLGAIIVVLQGLFRGAREIPWHQLLLGWILKTVESTLSQIRRRRARGTSGLWPSSP